jgi:hypothetical protein
MSRYFLVSVDAAEIDEIAHFDDLKQAKQGCRTMALCGDEHWVVWDNHDKVVAFDCKVANDPGRRTA